MPVHIDLLDRKLLFELDRNSRQPHSQLAKKLHVAKGVINYRIKRLEDNGILNGYYTVIDTTKLGYYHFRIYIKLKETPKREKEELVKYLVASERTWWVALTTFPYDIAAIFIAKSLHEFNEIFKEFLKKYKQNLHSYKVKMYVELKHFFRDYILYEEYMENRKGMIVGEEESVHLTGQEMGVLKELALNSRIGAVALAKKLKMSPITANSIIRRLGKNGVIKGFRILCDYSLLGYEYYWVHINVSNYEGGQKLAKLIAMFPQTVYLDETIGGSDIEFGVQVKRDNGIQSLLTKIFDKFNEIIVDYDYFKVLENRKVLYMPRQP